MSDGGAVRNIEGAPITDGVGDLRAELSTLMGMDDGDVAQLIDVVAEQLGHLRQVDRDLIEIIPRSYLDLIEISE